MKSAIVATILALATSSSASASIVVNLTDDASGFHAAYAGSVDLDGLSGVSNYAINPGTLTVWNRVVFGYIVGVGGAYSTGPAYAISSGSSFSDVINNSASNFTLNDPTTGSGTAFSLEVFLTSGPRFIIDSTYVSKEFFSGSNSWTGASKPNNDLASSIFNMGRYVYTLSNDETITLNIGNNYSQALPQVPLPAGLPLLGSAAVAMFALRRRCRRGSRSLSELAPTM